MVLTDEVKVDKYPVATLEDKKLSIEESYYSIDRNNIVVKTSVAGLTDASNTYTNSSNTLGDNPQDASFEAANSEKIYKLNKNSAKTGLGITLKVMAGDRIDISGKSYYNQNNPTNGTDPSATIPITEILSGLIGGAGGVVATTSHEAVTVDKINTTTNTGEITDLFSDQTTNFTTNTSVPKAYMNYIFFDEQFKSVGSGFSRVGANGVVFNHTNLSNIVVPKNGYMYIYCSNESPVNVFFDNVQAVHTRGPILEETHYYPFGLTMQGISSKAAGGVENRYKANGGTEFNNDFNISLYETTYRGLDPQIGRFWQIDPLGEEFEDWSPYTFANDNPIYFSDPLGLAATNDTTGNNPTDHPELAITVTAKAPKKLDSENGQVLPPLPWYSYIFGSNRKWNGYPVDNAGFVHAFMPTAFIVPDIGIKSNAAKQAEKAIAKYAGKKIVGKYLVYRAYKQVQGRLLLYIGKAKSALSNRYTAREIEQLGVEVIEKLDNLPDNATALGVEQALIELNGGVNRISGATSNINNAAVKEIYKSAGLKWLNENVPNWKQVFKFQ